MVLIGRGLTVLFEKGILSEFPITKMTKENLELPDPICELIVIRNKILISILGSSTSPLYTQLVLFIKH